MSDIIDKMKDYPRPDLDPEEPEFIIERDDEETESISNGTGGSSVPRHKKWLRRLLKAIAVVMLVAMTLAAYRIWNYYFNIGVPISTTPSENIEKLKEAVKPETAEVVHTNDSLLGVALDFYAIHGLRANIQFEEPDTADTSVFLYCRSADHNADGTYLGSLVVDGKELQNDRSRLGYMAMTGDRMVIGISRREAVKDYVVEQGGSFFRQFILVSDGVIPQRFFLHGKVERRALGRIGDTLYFIATRNKETLWDFADALREYGFTDAIYITGGYEYVYYRDAQGTRHDIGNVAEYPHKKWKGIIPWLVFRKI